MISNPATPSVDLADLDEVYAQVAALSNQRHSGLFVATREAALSVTTGDVVVFDTEEIDASGWYDPATGRFTPQLAGTYELAAMVGINASNSVPHKYIWPRVRKNGVTHKTLGLEWIPGGMSSTLMGGGSCKVEANGSTDYFDVRVDHSDTGARALLVGSEFCRFSGALVAPSP